MIIDATNSICGRIATVAAKKALLGEKIDVVNCEKAVISGERRFVIEKWKSMNQRGVHKRGPFIYKMPDRFVKRIIRGMLNYKQERGLEAFKRIKCHIGVPAGMEKAQVIKEALADKLPNNRYVTVYEITQEMKRKE